MHIITRGARIGPCNIRGIVGPLTEDHIPSKGVSRLSQVVILKLIDPLGVERAKKSGRISQNGVKFRTLCARCNNKRLGIHCDPTLISFTRAIRSYLDSALHLPPNDASSLQGEGESARQKRRWAFVGAQWLQEQIGAGKRAASFATDA